jgi:tetratricopeptide (TPR) repeat protein
MSNLALVLDNQGKYAEAEKLYQKALALSQKVLGAEHPYTLKIMRRVNKFGDC